MLSGLLGPAARADFESVCEELAINDVADLVGEIERLRGETERLHGRIRQAFDAIDNPILDKGPKHFTRYPCPGCGFPVSNAGYARRSHERGKVHQAALASQGRR